MNTNQAIRLYETIEAMMNQFKRENNPTGDFLDWTRSLPTESGDYWWWNEDEDSRPIRVTIMWSGTTQSCFASMGQHGWSRHQDVEDMGGYWMVSEDPELPKRDTEEKG